MEQITKQEKETLFKVDTAILLDVVKTLKELVSEVRLKISRDGIKICEMDNANVCMFNLEIGKHRFIDITENQEIRNFGVNLDSLYKILKENKKHNVKIEVEDNQMILTFDNGINSKMPLIEVEGEEKKIPMLDFNSGVSIDSKRFKEILKHCISNSETVCFETINNTFKISTSGLNPSEIILDDVKVSGESKCKYSLEYIDKFIKVLFSEKIEVLFSDDYPMSFIQENDGFKLNFILAPRICEDE